MKGLIAGIAVAAATMAAIASGAAATAAGVGKNGGHGGPGTPKVDRITLRLASNPDQVANVADTSTSNGAPVIQWPLSGTDTNELWEPESTLDGYYRFRAVHSGLCLNVSGGGTADGTPVIQYTCGNAANELWRFVQNGLGYQIVVKSSGKCLNVSGGVGQGNPLIQYACTAGGAANDVWLPVWEPTR